MKSIFVCAGILIAGSSAMLVSCNGPITQQELACILDSSGTVIQVVQTATSKDNTATTSSKVISGAGTIAIATIANPDCATAIKQMSTPSAAATSTVSGAK